MTKKIGQVNYDCRMSMTMLCGFWTPLLENGESLGRLPIARPKNNPRRDLLITIQDKRAQVQHVLTVRNCIRS